MRLWTRLWMRLWQWPRIGRRAVTAWLLSIDGTPQGAWVATGLALISALFHAIFGAMQKGRYDPWIIRGAIDFWYLVLALPVAVFFVPWPSAQVWMLLMGVFFIHLIYKILLAKAYARAGYTVVYPVVRGTGPLATVVFAGFVFHEQFTAWQWGGVALLSGGIFALAGYNYRKTLIGRDVLLAALGFAVLTGVMVAVYTTYDAFGVRAAANPFTFIIWFFVIDGMAFPAISFVLWWRMARPYAPIPLLRQGFLGALVACVSFGGVMLATRLDKVGEAAVLRETSVIFAALIGWFVLREPVGPRRLMIILMIAAGAVVVEFGG